MTVVTTTSTTGTAVVAKVNEVATYKGTLACVGALTNIFCAP
ncbi:MAG: hypothetical protein AB7V28_12625 [Arcobacteraceae bacterium]|jgi:hypothetical protein